MRSAIALILCLSANPCFAHGSATALIGSAAWTYDAWLTIPLYGLGILFLLGTRAVWRRAGFGRGVRPAQAACFWSGWLILALALISPLHWLSERLFFVHMTEHELLMVVAAPLMAFARPGQAVLWSLPRGWRQTIGSIPRAAAIAVCWSVLRNPMTATILQAGVLWLWHIPSLYEAALTNEAVHRLQHLSFFLTAFLFWWTLFHGHGKGGGERVRYGINVGCLFVTAMHCGLLGALLTLSRRIWFPEQVAFAASWGLTPLEDQQLAGLIMWIPMGMIYTAAGLYFAWRWIVRSSAGNRLLFNSPEIDEATFQHGKPHRLASGLGR